MADETEPMTDPLRDVAEVMPHEPVAPAHGVAAIALAMAMKYADIATVQDGALYQQYKLEGRNLPPLQLDWVFEIAIQIEKHLVLSQERIAKVLIDAIAEGIEDEQRDPVPATTGTTGEDG